ncbi:UDP-GalNAc:beta-1,3-N-acetylgalactosaminyltransferase 2 isoform X2 [Micropterus dolomieu]|uniref:UDP-GalNAc:beta-1, 3-N-acetylgalactosaminyltransferase 2 isoform X2 n=1 Tax=Micropterus dolomieu TaxID=147949 RepID=UPI001E8E792C|nr:UDP-GalNAc:beta-1,3-N-acetylgalactosaminyltransferase 2 isoform X2 [Micropterus dolomieu]
MRRLALILLPCAVAVLVHLWLAQRPSSTPLDNNIHTDEALPFCEVLVGVLSARHHYELRQAIRETWLGYLRDHPHFQHRVGVKFIVGEHGCPIPEEDREDPYSCSLLNFTEPGAGQDAEIEIVTLSDPSTLAPSDVSAIALDFKVLHPVVITRLGVFTSGTRPELQSNVTVKLLQLDQEEAVVTARFSAISTGTMVNGVWYKPVEQFILPKGFEGTLVWKNLDSAGLTTVNSSSVQLNDGGGVLKISSIAEGILPHRSALGFPGLAGGFTFTIYDGDGLTGLLRGRPARMEHHASRLREEDAALQRESLRHGDIVFVDVVDTYRNVPSKLLQFYKCFRQSWAVDRIGKWQELEYASPAYPAFACGSGYVVSRDLVQWLASNADKLKAYQGEDVSMGIWMAAVGPQKYQDPGWLCEKECYLDMLSSPQHTAEELHILWDRKRACGDPCGCPWDH